MSRRQEFVRRGLEDEDRIEEPISSPISLTPGRVDRTPYAGAY